MRIDRFTQRAQEAIVGAQGLAEREGHPQLEVAHILLVLVDQADGVVPAVLDRMRVQPAWWPRRCARSSRSSPRWPARHSSSASRTRPVAS